MQTKNIFKTVAFAMLMPTMLLTTSCSSEDDAFNNAENTETVAKKGYTLPVTVNASRQNVGTRATYDAENKKLNFSAGDKLFIKGDHSTAGQFAGVLDFVSNGSFNGTITTEHEWTGTAHELFKSSNSASGFLMPAGYGDYGFYAYAANNGYDATLTNDPSNAIALTKAAAVEQFSEEWGSYSFTEDAGNFVLVPHNAIVSFTIHDFPEANQNYDIEIRYLYVDDAHEGHYAGVNKTVMADASGTEIFAIGVPNNTQFNNSFSVTAGGAPIHLANNPTPDLEAGNIYNITRDVACSVLEATTADIGKLVGADGKIYTSKATATAGGTTAVAMIAYVGNQSNCEHGLAIALANEIYTMTWSEADAIWENKNSSLPVTNAKWRLPSVEDWQNMFIGCGASGEIVGNPTTDYAISYGQLNSKLTAIGGTALLTDKFWTLTQISENVNNAYKIRLDGPTGEAHFSISDKGFEFYARACLSF